MKKSENCINAYNIAWKCSTTQKLYIDIQTISPDARTSSNQVQLTHQTTKQLSLDYVCALYCLYTIQISPCPADQWSEMPLWCGASPLIMLAAWPGDLSMDLIADYGWMLSVTLPMALMRFQVRPYNYGMYSLMEENSYSVRSDTSGLSRYIFNLTLDVVILTFTSIWNDHTNYCDRIHANILRVRGSEICIWFDLILVVLAVRTHSYCFWYPP